MSEPQLLGTVDDQKTNQLGGSAMGGAVLDDRRTPPATGGADGPQCAGELQIVARQNAFQSVSQRANRRSYRRVERAARGIVRDATRSFGLLDRIRTTAAGRITLKVTVAVVGVITVLLGLLMVVLPGPGWLVVFFGLAILSVEYVWAKHVLRYGREKVRAWTRWVARQPWWLRGAVGALGLIFLAALVWWGMRNGFGGDQVESLWWFLTSR